MEIPPSPPVAPSPLDAWRARRHLGRLARRLRRRGWTAQARFTASPPLLRVFDARVPRIGDSIAANREEAGWWFMSSTGERLAPCADPDWAVSKISVQLAPFISCALERQGPL
ncbi:hypothetical protein [Actinomadura rubrisoli]|uniref:Uncharacterized protein n=1 Tax=Actinomadura rubrisoli TaxID=2530368 RepID=A0A4R5BL54_9ACTN|nr:hypothetical protein [Actinomadura rubrisoli]TDD87528.1 hypothetical protein E1298_15975 [Actinomadura rubrisoli]